MNPPSKWCTCSSTDPRRVWWRTAPGSTTRNKKFALVAAQCTRSNHDACRSACKGILSKRVRCSATFFSRNASTNEGWPSGDPRTFIPCFSSGKPGPFHTSSGNPGGLNFAGCFQLPTRPGLVRIFIPFRGHTDLTCGQIFRAALAEHGWLLNPHQPACKNNSRSAHRVGLRMHGRNWDFKNPDEEVRHRRCATQQDQPSALKVLDV